MPTRTANRTRLKVAFRALSDAAQTNFLAWLRQPTARWSWRIDGPALFVVIATLLADRTPLRHSLVIAWMNVVAIFAIGLILHRNLRRDVKWRDVRKQFEERVSRRQSKSW